MATARMQEGWARTQVRLPPEIHSQIQEVAQTEDRSLNAQIVAMLREGLATRRTKEVVHATQS